MLLALSAAALALAACSSSSSTGSTSTSAVTVTTTADQVQTFTNNIGCVLHTQSGAKPKNSTQCFTLSPPQSATLNQDGTVDVCSGKNCLPRVGSLGTALPVGTSVNSLGGKCLLLSQGVNCTLANGKGFLLTSSGASAVGHAVIERPTGG